MGRRKNLKEDDPLKGAIEIYGRVISIEAGKGHNSLFPYQRFRHDFEKGAKIFGLKDGSVLIKSKNGKRLWREFDYK